MSCGLSGSLEVKKSTVNVVKSGLILHGGQDRAIHAWSNPLPHSPGVRKPDSGSTSNLETL
jgi:hypothetical protein